MDRNSAFIFWLGRSAGCRLWCCVAILAVLSCSFGSRAVQAQTSLVPFLTSDSGTGVTVSASTAGSGDDAWCAFDGVETSYTTGNVWTTAPGYTTGWLQVQFTTPTVVDAYTIWCYTADSSVSSYDTSRSPSSWQFQGSADGATWVTLDAESGKVPNSVSGNSYSAANTVAYSYYRLNCLANNGDPSFVSVNELQLFGGGSGGPVTGGFAAPNTSGYYNPPAQINLPTLPGDLSIGIPGVGSVTLAFNWILQVYSYCQTLEALYTGVNPVAIVTSFADMFKQLQVRGQDLVNGFNNLYISLFTPSSAGRASQASIQADELQFMNWGPYAALDEVDADIDLSGGVDVTATPPDTSATEAYNSLPSAAFGHDPGPTVMTPDIAAAALGGYTNRTLGGPLPMDAGRPMARAIEGEVPSSGGLQPCVMDAKDGAKVVIVPATRQVLGHVANYEAGHVMSMVKSHTVPVLTGAAPLEGSGAGLPAIQWGPSSYAPTPSACTADGAIFPGAIGFPILQPDIRTGQWSNTGATLPFDFTPLTQSCWFVIVRWIEGVAVYGIGIMGLLRWVLPKATY